MGGGVEVEGEGGEGGVKGAEMGRGVEVGGGAEDEDEGRGDAVGCWDVNRDSSRLSVVGEEAVARTAVEEWKEERGEMKRSRRWEERLPVWLDTAGDRRSTSSSGRRMRCRGLRAPHRQPQRADLATAETDIAV